MKQNLVINRSKVLLCLLALLVICFCFSTAFIVINTAYADDQTDKAVSKLVDVTGDRYTHTYLDEIDVKTPVLLDETTYDKQTLVMRLYLNDEPIGDDEGFATEDFNEYVNRAMPAGNYKLVISVTEKYTINDDLTEDDEIQVNQVSETLEFVVNQKQGKPSLSDYDFTSLHQVLQDKTFTYAWRENTTQKYDSVAAISVNNALNNLANDNEVRANTVWASADYNRYYNAAVWYKTEKISNDSYYPSDNPLVATDTVGKHKVFYKVYAPNYDAPLEDIDSWQDYYFYVINVKEVNLPIISSKTYNGEVQKADITDTEYYTVDFNNGGINAGTYKVSLTLKNPDYYMWQGQTLEDKTATVIVAFEITKINNSWMQSLSVTAWTEGKYDQLDLEKGERPIKAAALYGTVTLTLINADDPDTVLYEGANKTESLETVLKGLKAGTYILTASVKGFANTNDMSDFVVFKVFPQEGLHWWAITLIVIAALGVAALVLVILHQKGVLQVLTGKLVIAMRTRMTVDATIAAVRANKVAEESKKSQAEAAARERAEMLKRAREEARNRSPEEQAAVLEERAQEAAAKAEKMRERAEKIQQQADEMRGKASADESGNN